MAFQLSPAIAQIWQNIKPQIKGIASDSRQIKSGYVFAALPSSSDQPDGAHYIQQAKDNGALYVLGGQACDTGILPLLASDNARQDYALLATDIYGMNQPANQFAKTIAVTGTNGKSSIVWMLRYLWHDAQIKGASIGTHGVYQGLTRRNDSSLTTPDAADLMQIASQLRQANCDHLALEASSHGLAQSRLAGFAVDVAIMTNLSRDHLDYHSDFEDYRQAKYRLFRDYVKQGGAFLVSENYDKADELRAIASLQQAKFYQYGFDRQYDFALYDLQYRDNMLYANLQLLQENHPIKLPLVGKFQWENALAAAASAYLAGMDGQAVARAMSAIKTVWGRLELATSLENGAQIFVDYAHTPEALQNALQVLREHLPYVREGGNNNMGQLHCLFGCGGNRDQGKRIEMAHIAQAYADNIIVTDDNPRHENPAAIRMAILAGCQALNIAGRARAIHTAIRALRAGDILLIAGKGHEDYQIIGNEKTSFDDRQQVLEAVKNYQPILWDKNRLLQADPQMSFASNLVSENSDSPIYGIAIDSRNARTGDLFLALSDRRDGHDFIDMAKQQGCALSLGTRAPADIMVTDVLASLGKMAQHQRNTSQAVHIGVTGSMGKTSVKNGVARMFASLFDCHVTPGNFNNHIGLPLSLATMPDASDVGVFELGMNHAGEIADLTAMLRPDIALITNIAPVHLEFFDSLQDIARAKAEIFLSMAKDSYAILPFDSEYYDLLRQSAAEKQLNIISFGTKSGADIQVVQMGMLPSDDNIPMPAYRWHFLYQGASYAVTGFVAGAQWGQILSAIMACAVAYCQLTQQAVEEFLPRLLAGLDGMHPPQGRGNSGVSCLQDGRKIHWIDESYNASPLAMQVALQNLAQMPQVQIDTIQQGRKIAILGDMRELGQEEIRFHQELLPFCVPLDQIHVVGDHMAHLYELLPPNKKGICAKNVETLAEKLLPMLESEDIMMVKGSASMKMKYIIEQIIRMNHV